MLCYAQVGVNTTNPQGMFHIDGAKDNPATGTPNTTQVANDFVVIPTGNVGLGTTTPSTKLEISSGMTGESGLKFNNINNATATAQNAATLGVDSNGKVVIQSIAP